MATIVEIICKHCGKIRSFIKRDYGGQQYCSHLCANRANRKFGSDNPAWHERPKLLLGEENWRKRPYKRLCSICGKGFESHGYREYCSDECRKTNRGRFHTKKTKDGYEYTYWPEYPGATKHGYVATHRMIWEQHHSKQLSPGWVVHHLNGIKDDNRIDNLLALPERMHKLILRAQQTRIRILEARIKYLETHYQPSLLAS